MNLAGCQLLLTLELTPLCTSRRETLKSFDCSVNEECATGQNQGTQVLASIGQWRGAAFVTPPLSAASGGITECNIVGMGILQPEIRDAVGKIFTHRFFSHVEKIGGTWVKGAGVAFKVTPTEDTIDSLKDAIKAKIGAKYPSLIAPDITINDPDTQRPVEKQSAPLKANSEENPYQFELPSGS